MNLIVDILKDLDNMAAVIMFHKSYGSTYLFLFTAPLPAYVLVPFLQMSDPSQDLQILWTVICGILLFSEALKMR